MITNTRMETFLVLLKQQTELIEILAQQETELQQRVADRDWESVETLVGEMTSVSEAISRVEEDRNALFLEIACELGGETDFAVVLSRMPMEIRTLLSQRYRELKIAVLRLQSRTANMDAYLRSSLATNRSVLRELFPEHATPGYSSDGQGRLQAGTALMVNSHH
ncbi:MAG: hypothetical protein EA427_09310 [Spirochaetaceae bacterium]|nr:MAG: hypothetical protein EA427_09310 [Spirochaetaceae bacterium]